MFDQLFENFRRASESSLQTQQEMFKQWAQQWPSPSLNGGGGGASDQARAIQKRWKEVATNALQEHHEVVDASYRSGIQVIEQAFRISEAKSPEDHRRLMEDLWRKTSEIFKQQGEAQLRQFKKVAEQWLNMPQVIQDTTRAEPEQQE